MMKYVYIFFVFALFSGQHAQSAADDPVVNPDVTAGQWNARLPVWSAFPISLRDDVEYLQEKANVTALLDEEPEWEELTTGLLLLGQCFRNLVRAPDPTHHHYTERDWRIVNSQLLQMGMIIQSTRMPFMRFPHLVRDVNSDELDKAKEVLNNLVGKTPEEINNSKKVVLFSRIPWRLLESISRALLRDSISYHANNLILLQQAWEQLRPEIPVLLRYRDNLLRVHVCPDLVPLGDLGNDVELWSDMPVLRMIGGYWKDQSYGVKLREEFKTLDHMGGAALKGKKSRYALLRLVTVLGETGKYLSPYLKRRVGQGIWRNSARIRDSFHSPRGFRRFFRMVGGEPRSFFFPFLPELEVHPKDWTEKVLN